MFEESPVPSTPAQTDPPRTRRPRRWDRPGPEPEVVAERRSSPHRDLFLVSFTILFLELACIRWFAGAVIFLTFFTNLVLLACFLGMSVGCLAASRRRDLRSTVIPLTLVAVALSAVTYWAHGAFGKVLIDVGGQGSPQQVYFGAEFHSKDPGTFVVPIEAVAGVFFALIALMFVGLGQALGRALGAIPDRIAAYTTNIVGSLVGIVGFGLASYLRTPPVVWFAVGLGAWCALVPRRGRAQVLGALAVLLVVAYQGHWEGTRARVYWSPYYKVSYDPKGGVICTNNLGHQAMMAFGSSGPAYALPHLLNRDAGGAPFEDVLIVGAGSGNDVAAALALGAKHVDAVEIDPVLHEIGREDHPNRPYADPRVTVHLDDGRSFVRNTARKYDLVIYAVVDSLVLHSGYSSLRLESFLFTEQAFRDIRAKLKPGGVFAMYNYYRQGWVVCRLEKMARTAFGAPPLVLSLPYKESVTPDEAQGGYLNCLLAGEGPALARIRTALAAWQSYWAHIQPAHNLGVLAYGPTPPAVPGTQPGQWLKIAPARVESAGIGRVPSDNWPFLYLRSRSIPALNLRGIAIVAALSLAILLAFAPVRTARPSGRMFFLGAGFMLLETKGVVHMALLFGSTWVVNSIVFLAVLVMILLSNLWVQASRPRRLWPAYAGLAVALLVNALVPTGAFLALPGTARLVASCAVTFVPIAFAGVIFATALRDSPRPDVDLGSNVGGAILGGLAENLTLAIGFESLMLVALAFYGLSALLRPRPGLRPAPVAVVA